MINYSAPPEKEQIHQPADQMPYWAIGRMLMTDGTHWFVGTGSLIQPQYVLTAAHVVHGKTAGTITFAYDVNDNNGNPGRTVQIARAAIPTKYGQQGWDI